MRLKGDCNTGTTYPKHKGWCKGFHMWLVESGIENLLIVPQIEAYGFTIDYNNKLDWVVTTPEGEEIVFKKDTGKCKGFTFIEMDTHEALALLKSVSKVNTVRVNYEGFTKTYVGKAISTRKAQTMIGIQSKKYFKVLVSENCTALKYIPVTCADITKAHTIFGPYLSGVQGKNARQKPVRVETEETYVPRYFYGFHKLLTLTVDVMFVKRVPFIVTLS